MLLDPLSPHSVETLLQIIGVITVMVMIVGAIIFFDIPAWVPGDRKPNKEAMGIIIVLFGLIVCVIIGSVIWENIVN